ncbi:hypothetical protein [Telluribacter humicola]|uniref:hypothetical protein n=1 Tax=Telluribacter humicola TaxID=1720261 RepID=UPI001A95950E|nr:hypothetical protein [Telluribacter humicola]
MKKYTFFILLGVCLLAGTVAQAQFQSGQRFISGTADLSTNRYSEQTDLQYIYSHSMHFSVGRFTRDNRAMGWSFSNALSIYKSGQFVPEARALGYLSFGIGRFVEYYQPLGRKFALYGRPSVGVGYNLQNQFSVASAPTIAGKWVLFNQVQRHTFSLDVSLSGGIMWRFAEKWALQGSVAGISPLGLGFSRSIDDRYGLAPNTQKEKISQTQLGFNLRTELNTGSIGLGLRYFY